ncbi:hypothetical protein C8R45DRAFT_1099751 [Mycena sanguinolenta]|nr:hypothetical protein C8R45DRAFT_1099751 [Mycena sanguinolenta]
MTFPSTFDAYVPSNGLDFFAVSNFTPTYVPLTPPATFLHVIRCFYFALALLYTGFPSGTPGVPQIAFDELTLRLYHTTLLHDLGFSNTSEAPNNPAHAMTFELHGGFMAYDHLHAAAPNLDAYQVGDIVQSIVLHTSQWPFGNSSANQILMSISAMLDVGGYNGTALPGLNFSSLWHPKTVEEIEKAYPRGNFYQEGIAGLDSEFGRKPNCLLSHVPGGLDTLSKNFLVGPIVPIGSNYTVRGLEDPHLLN